MNFIKLYNLYIQLKLFLSAVIIQRMIIKQFKYKSLKKKYVLPL